MIEIIIAALATYGVCTLLAEYNGAFDIFLKIRSKLSAFRCVPCASVWIGLPIAYFSGIGLEGYLAVLGVVLLLDRVNL